MNAPAGGRGRGRVKLRGGTRASAPLRPLVGRGSLAKTRSRFCSQKGISMHVGALLPVPHLPPPRRHGHAANPELACSDTWWTPPAVPAPLQAASISQTEPWAEKGGLKEISSRMRPDSERAETDLCGSVWSATQALESHRLGRVAHFGHLPAL